MGGEKSSNPCPSGGTAESPPRRRGKDKAEHLVQDHIGITPAQAGKSGPGSCTGRCCGDHPRTGGEKHQIDFRGTVGLGSSPHRRGKAHLWIIHQIFIRITPAWAGKRSVELFLSVLSLDHPRVGGEKTVKVPALVVPTGSPLRGRGKAACGALAGGVQRITPAWAGKRNITNGRAGRTQDHPRVGGEKIALTGNAPVKMGSPPRGRGKVWH